jgi:hypothetical protein
MLTTEGILEAVELANAGRLDVALKLYSHILSRASRLQGGVLVDVELFAHSVARRALVPAVLGKALVAAEAGFREAPLKILKEHLQVLSDLFGDALPHCSGFSPVDVPWRGGLFLAARLAEDGDLGNARARYSRVLIQLELAADQVKEPFLANHLARSSRVAQAVCWLGLALTLPGPEAGRLLLAAAPVFGGFFGGELIPFASQGTRSPRTDDVFGKVIRQPAPRSGG